MPNNRKNIPKSTWLPLVLAIYFIGMAVWFGPELIRKGEILRFILVSIVEIAVIIAVRYFYKAKETGKKNMH